MTTTALKVKLRVEFCYITCKSAIFQSASEFSRVGNLFVFSEAYFSVSCYMDYIFPCSKLGCKA